MMQVTVKTLDSQTKSFSVPDEATVKEFKQQIEQELEITADRQRLIFKGKVLQDEKKLQEYGVDGCVVHLVQRVPPSESQTRTRDTPTTSSTATGPGGGGNFVMGAFTLPIDVMGVTQQIVQSLVNQLGVDSAQANISTSHSDEGAALNVHINLHATSQPGSDVGQRISRARNFLRSARESLNRTEAEGMLSGHTVMDTGGTTQTGQPASPVSPPDSGSTNQETRPSHSPLNLADILCEVQQISASLQPALDRYATLLSSSSTADLQPSDDSLPDRIAETLHNLSHSYHALSDLTFNFRSQEPRYVRVLPPLSPHSPSPLGGLLPPRRGPTTAPQQVVSGSQSRPANGQREQQPLNQPGRLPAITLSVNPQGGIAFTSIMSTISRAMASTQPASATSQTGPTTSSSTTASTLPRNIFAPDFTSHTSSASTGTTNSTTNRQAAGPNTRIVVDDIIAMISGGPGPVISPQTSTASPPSSTAGSSSNGQQQPQSTSTPQAMHVGPSPVNANHPDPSVPCQSFHFGPQARSMVPRQGSNQPGTTSGTPQARRHRPTTEDVIQQVREAMAESGIDAPEIPGQIREIIEGDPNRPQRINPELFTDPEVPDWLRNLVTRAARDEDIGDLPTMAQVEEEVRRQEAARERRRDQSEEEPRGQRAQRLEESTAPARESTEGGVATDLLGRIMAQIQSHSEESTAPEGRGSADGSANPTIGEMIRDFDSSHSQEPDEEGDVINPLFRRLTSSLTVPDLMDILAGSYEPFNRLRPELVMYLRTDLLHGAEPTDENLKRAVEQLVDQIVDHIYTGFSGIPEKEGIDLKASLTSFLKFYIQHAVDIVARSEDNPDFGEHFCSLLQDMSSEFFTLVVMCLRDGIGGLEDIVQTRMPISVVTHDLDPGMRHLFSRIVLSHIRQMYERTRYAEPRLQRHVIRTTANQETATAQPAKRVGESSTRVSQPAAPEAVTTQADDAHSENSDQSDDFTTPPASIVTQDQEGDVAMETDDARDDVDEDWKAVMPEEWVPIITRDIVHQRRVHPQAPFSDAYLAGVPPKRRKMVDQRGVVAAEEVLPEALKRAASAAGVSPRTSLEAFTNAVGDDKELQHAYQKEIKKEVESRLEKDSDYKPEQFPNTREYFDRRSKRK